jgi:hypothetical protein
LIDGYLGIGIKYREVKNIGREHYLDYLKGDRYFPNGDLKENSGFAMMFPLGIRLVISSQ